MKGKWYITAEAAGQYMRMQGWTGELAEENPEFRRARSILAELSETARPILSQPQDHGGILFRGYLEVRGRRQRVECVVRQRPREEGWLPQLVRLRRKSR